MAPSGNLRKIAFISIGPIPLANEGAQSNAIRDKADPSISAFDADLSEKYD